MGSREPEEEVRQSIEKDDRRAERRGARAGEARGSAVPKSRRQHGRREKEEAKYEENAFETEGDTAFNLIGAGMKSELDKLYALIEDIKITMMTTRRRDGHLESRAMATQKPAAGADLWFVTAEGTAKLDDIATDPHVNLAFFKEGSWEWISVSGVATISHDRTKIHELYEPDWKIWFAEEGDPRHGTADDPRMVLIGVDVHAAVFLEVNKPKPIVLYELAKGWLTGDAPTVGDTHVVGDARRRAGA